MSIKSQLQFGGIEGKFYLTLIRSTMVFSCYCHGNPLMLTERIKCIYQHSCWTYCLMSQVLLLLSNFSSFKVICIQSETLYFSGSIILRSFFQMFFHHAKRSICELLCILRKLFIILNILFLECCRHLKCQKKKKKYSLKRPQQKLKEPKISLEQRIKGVCSKTHLRLLSRIYTLPPYSTYVRATAEVLNACFSQNCAMIISQKKICQASQRDLGSHLVGHLSCGSWNELKVLQVLWDVKSQSIL